MEIERRSNSVGSKERTIANSERNLTSYIRLRIIILEIKRTDLTKKDRRGEI